MGLSLGELLDRVRSLNPSVILASTAFTSMSGNGVAGFGMTTLEYRIVENQGAPIAGRPGIYTRVETLAGDINVVFSDRLVGSGQPSQRFSAARSDRVSLTLTIGDGDLLAGGQAIPVNADFILRNWGDASYRVTLRPFGRLLAGRDAEGTGYLFAFTDLYKLG